MALMVAVIAMTFSVLHKHISNYFRKFLLKPQRTMATLHEIIENNQRNQDILQSVQSEVKAMRNEFLARRKQQLAKENGRIQAAIEVAKTKLIDLEVRHGKTQISMPGARHLCTDGKQVAAETMTAATSAPVSKMAEKVVNPGTNHTAKEKKAKKENAPNVPAVELPIDVGRLDMRVGKIIEVGRHPDADSLYLEKIDCGEPQPRTVVSGLVKFVPLQEMQNRMVVVLCNLKPAKMRGVTSEAMVMCASTPDKVEVLSPPIDAVPGDLVHCEGYSREPDTQLNPKKKIFETCAPDLRTNDSLIACYKVGALHVPGKGNIVAQTLKNVNVK